MTSLLAPGRKLERYEIVRAVAQGGMGAVWLGRLRGKHGFEKLVAIKVILPTYARAPQFREMFLEEARIASRIEHANIAQILDLGEDDDTLYLVMEWVDGHALDRLQRRLRERRASLPLPALLRIAADACAGLHAAHEAKDERGERLGIVHRDVSPQNILVRDNGAVKVIDFGIARARLGLAEDARASHVRGKVHYMAPEQASAQIVDARADVWSLGAVLYESLSGAPPVLGLNDLAALIEGRREIPALPREVAPEVRVLVRRALAVDRALRFESALAMQRALEEAIAALGAPTTSADVAHFLATTLPRELRHDDGELADPRTSATAGTRTARDASMTIGDACVVAGDAEDDPLSLRATARAVPTQVVVFGNAREAVASMFRYEPLDALDAFIAREPSSARVGIFDEPSAACDAFNRGRVDAFVMVGFDQAALEAAAHAARERAPRRARSRDEQLADEDRLRRLAEEHAASLDTRRRQRAQAANVARLALLGELEIRRAHARRGALSLLVYRMHRPKFATPAGDGAIVYAALTGRSTVTEQYGEIVAVIPEEGAAEVNARLERRPSVGQIAVMGLVESDSFATLVERTRAALEQS